MVAKSPRSRLRETAAVAVAAAAPLSPTLLRDTVKKVDKCVARLQELQHTVGGGRKVISLPPRTTTTYLPTSVRCKDQAFRIKNAIGQRSSPTGKLPPKAEEWRRMSLPAMLLGETVREIVQTSRFTRTVVEAVSKKHTPSTPPTERRKNMMIQHSELHARRKREKQNTQSSESNTQRAKSRIIFEASSPRQRHDKQNCSNYYIANRVSPKNRPWAKKTVLFPNPLFQSSPAIERKNRAVAQKYLIKSPPPSASKVQVKIKRSESDCLLGKKSDKSRRSFSPSELAMKLVRESDEKNGKMIYAMISRLKQHPNSAGLFCNSFE